MKQKFAILFVLALLVVPSFSLAATRDEMSVQYQNSLRQVIALLIQEVKMLQAQLAAQQANGAVSTPATTTTITGGTLTPMPSESLPVVACSLTIGDEGTSQVLRDGVWTTSKNGTFQLSWSFPAEATGMIGGGTLNRPSGTMTVHLNKDESNNFVDTTFTLNVSQESYAPATCSVTASHGQ